MNLFPPSLLEVHIAKELTVSTSDNLNIFIWREIQRDIYRYTLRDINMYMFRCCPLKKNVSEELLGSQRMKKRA